MEEKNVIADETMEDVMEDVDKTMMRIHTGDILEGKVVSVNEDSVIVNIGYHTDGIILNNELSSKKDVSPADIVSVDDIIDVKVLEVDDGEGNVLLSKKRAEALVAWDYLEEAQEKESILEVTIEESVKGGVISHIKGVRAFIPASQLSDRYVEDISTFVGKTIRAEIIELDRSKNQLVLSSKRLAKEDREAREKAAIAKLKEGDQVTGKVVKLMPFGAFVDIGDIQGLLHNSNLSWERIDHPSEVVKEGQEIKVTIIKVDEEEGKVGLGFKDMALDPWIVNTENLKKNTVVEGTVTRLVDFGAFVKIAESVEGLVHISQISEKRIDHPSNVLEEGQKIKVKILDIDRKKKRISLSIKEAENALNAELVKEYTGSEDDSLGTIGDALGDAFKDLFD